ncbi:MAG: insulinase family protein [Bacteroidetes bacterium]|nr:insulinase family protein [Bacteroidota bacterium]
MPLQHMKDYVRNSKDVERGFFAITFIMVLFFMLPLSAQVSISPRPAPEPVPGLEDEVVPYTYVEVPNDPTGTRIYTLGNGLTVYLSVNDDEPRVQTYVAVRAGSKNDPAETTGLAHYLEHMLFKGTDNIGTQDWKQEKGLLEAISKLYEEHRQTDNPEEKARIYSEIDRISGQAAKLAIPNEYDKMLSAMGAKGTNAWTSFEQTVYTNDIPSTELQRWCMVESERFKTLVLRLFHTELETVYEEFNRAQDNDGRKAFKSLASSMFPDHPYGTQTTIGEGEHLKNPSMVNIEQYFNQYYVPGNMAICMVGDLDMEETIALIDRHFGTWVSKDVLAWKVPGGDAPKGVQRSEVFGLESESLLIGYRLPGANAFDLAVANIVDGILQNGKAGLMDLNLIQEQKVLEASSSVYDLHDHSMHIFSAKPREGQSLEEVESLILAQIEQVKRGDFPDWMLQAVVNNEMLALTRRFESNSGRANAYVTAFTLGISWEEYLNQYNFMKRIRKNQIQEFANKHYGNNFSVVHKRQGEDPDVYKVEKPVITPIVANRDEVSPFVQRFLNKKVDRETPVFVDYKRSISDSQLKNKVPFSFIKNSTNDLFTLSYILDMGRDHDELLPLAVDYLPFLGTDTCNAAALAQAFFRLGLNFTVSSGRDRVYVSLSGLDENLEAGLSLFEYVLAHVQPDPQAWSDMVDGILKARANAKTQKNTILWQAMYDYARYGEQNPFRNRMTEAELRAVDPAVLCARVQQMMQFEHRIFYYGPSSADKVSKLLDEYHAAPSKRKPIPEPLAYVEQPTNRNLVYFVHYDMVQAQIVMMAQGQKFNKALLPMAELFNNYFGSGLSSIVFQEIRETKALAYSAFASYTTPQKPDEAHYLRAFVGTQADKLPEAVSAMYALLQSMPEAGPQFEASRESVLKQIETDRITKAAMYWNRDDNLRKGLKADVREDIYASVSAADMAALRSFFQKEIAGKQHTYLVMADRSKVNMDLLRGLGEFRELSLEEVFGY